MTPKNILIIDDDPHIRDILRYTLEQEGLMVLEASHGKEGLTRALQDKPDIIILDILMPEMNGLDVCRELRKSIQTPVLFLSSKDNEIDKILGLELGGDDYMSKPFSPRELLARIKVMLRRLEQSTPADTMGHSRESLSRGAISLNLDTYTVLWHQQPVILTSTEFSLLEHFLRTPQKVYTRDELSQTDIFRDIVSERTIDSHIRRLRQKFATAGCETVVETVHGFGYKTGECQ